MRVIAKRTLRQFWQKRADAERALRDWHSVATRAVWRSPADIKAQFRSASFIAGNRIVFNIAGNKYRLIAMVRYDKGILFVRFIGTHAEYDEIDVRTI